MRVLEGNRSRTPIPADPNVESPLPDPPPHLDDYAREEWNRLAAGLHNIGILFEVDQAAFGAYCAAYSRWRHAEEEIQGLAETKPHHGLIEETEKGNHIQHPLVGIANKAMQDMVKYASEFGLTPAARARLAVDPKKPKGKFGDLIGKQEAK